MKNDLEEANNKRKTQEREEKEVGDKEWAAKREDDKTVLQKIQDHTTAKYKNRKSGSPPDRKFEKSVEKLVDAAKT